MIQIRKVFCFLKPFGWLTGLALWLTFSGCNRELPVEKPGLPLIFIDFKGSVQNTGLLEVTFQGDGNVSYTQGIADSSLDLSISSQYRKPVIVQKDPLSFLSDYPGVTILLWTLSDSFDPYEYFILGQKDYFEEMGIRGWSIGKSALGSWKWWFSDGINAVDYTPTAWRQPLNDKKWHLIGFSLDYHQKEARLFYDGKNVAVISLDNINLSATGTPFYIGSDPLTSNPLMDTYNGKIDEVGIWSRALTEQQVLAVYAAHRPDVSLQAAEKPDSITFMTWNIGLGGRRDGRYVGVQRAAEVIQESGADVVAIQELFGSGALLADQLGFYFYQRSTGIGVLSRYPIGKTYNVFKSQNAGAVNIEIPGYDAVVFCPVWLSYLPNTRAYISSGLADPDTIIAREMETRGVEMRYILWELQSLINNKDHNPLVLAGDFNSGSHLDWTEANKEHYYGLVVDFPVTRFVQNSGFIDSYRAVHPNETINRGFTWPLNFQEEFRDRLDFIYYTGSKLDVVRSSVVDTSSYVFFPSDHAAVLSTFMLKK